MVATFRSGTKSAYRNGSPSGPTKRGAMLRTLGVAVVALGVLGCGHRHETTPMDAGGADAATAADASIDAGVASLNVLFVGNSYTYVNDLPGMLASIASTSGVPPLIHTDMIASGGYALSDHWDTGDALTQILGGSYTHVVLQGQSEETLGTGSTFPHYAELFGQLIESVGARPTWFVTWARAAGDPSSYPWTFFSPGAMQDRITVAYLGAANSFANSVVSCVGEAFRRAEKDYPAIVLQQSDYSHPTVAGTYLAASTFYVALTGNPVPPASQLPAGLDPHDAASLRSIAAVGSLCSGVTVRGWANLEGCPPLAGPSSAANGVCQQSDPFGTPDAGPVEFLSGAPVTGLVLVQNPSDTAVGLSDSHRLVPPFSWTSGSFPGGSGSASGSAFCGASLAGGGACLLSVDFSGAASADGIVGLSVSNSYLDEITLPLHGTVMPRAWLAARAGIEGFPSPYCSPFECLTYSANPIGGVELQSLLVTNVGGAEVTSLGEGAPLAAPFSWGDAGFPGGAGTGTLGDASYPFCGAAPLAPGGSCLLTVQGTYLGSCLGEETNIDVAYSDAIGPVSPDGVWTAYAPPRQPDGGTCPLPWERVRFP
jgi:hypothetical protein